MENYILNYTKNGVYLNNKVIKIMIHSTQKNNKNHINYIKKEQNKGINKNNNKNS